MSTRPVIFISAVSRELHSARQLVANTLTFLGYEPDWQDIFGTEHGDLRAMLRRRVDASQGVVQIIGQCYGAEPPTPDAQFSRCSYTQYEALYAHSRGRKVWYLFVDEHFPADPHEPESEEKRELQTAYRLRVRKSNQLYRFHQDTRDLENSVLKLRDDLARLRRGVRQWAALVLVLLVICAASAFWLLKRGGETQDEIAKAQAELKGVRDEIVALRRGVLDYASTEARIKQQEPRQSAEQIETRTYAALGEQLGVDPKVLREKLPSFAERLRRAPETTNYEKANAAYIAKDYAETERLALQAAYEAEKAQPVVPSAVTRAYALAGNAARAELRYADGLKYHRLAAAATDRTHNPLVWAEQQWNIALVLNEQGKGAAAEAIYRDVLAEFQRVKGAEDPALMSIRNNLASTLYTQGKYAEAVKEYREVLALRTRALGPEAPDTLASRHNLALALQEEGKYAEAAQEYRTVAPLMERVLGPEHEDTLTNRAGLATAMEDEGNHAEAEKEQRAVLAIRERVFGPEHPDTLASRSNLARNLELQDRHEEAAKLFRETLAIRERRLGPEHPDTLADRSNLAAVLNSLGKLAEAEQEDRIILAIRERVLGPEHPDTLHSRNNLAIRLCGQKKFTEAEKEFRTTIDLSTRALGPEHPFTLTLRHNLANLWRDQGRSALAGPEFRTVLALREKTLGRAHPDTIGTRSNLADLLRIESKPVEAEAEFRVLISLLESKPEKQDLYVQCYGLSLCLAMQAKGPEALVYAKRSEDGLKKLLGTDHPNTKLATTLREQIETTFSLR